MTQDASGQAVPEIHNQFSMTISSREIADLTGKRHDNVLRDVEKMLLAIETADHLNFEGVYRDAKGEVRREYLLPQREMMILISGYRIDLRARIIDRWIELEQQAAALASSEPPSEPPVVLPPLRPCGGLVQLADIGTFHNGLRLRDVRLGLALGREPGESIRAVIDQQSRWMGEEPLVRDGAGDYWLTELQCQQVIRAARPGDTAFLKSLRGIFLARAHQLGLEHPDELSCPGGVVTVDRIGGAV